ncbi:MAG: hypothetical protein GY869_10270 [Planctomycetes bacterium]|nr:hypothetical protein [Planctomycetota bacterium]
MKKLFGMVMGPKQERVLIPLILVGIILGLSLGCEQPLRENETYHKKAVAWPLFDVEKWEGINPEDGTRWKREVGDLLILATWEKEERFDKDNFRIYRREKGGFFPLWFSEIEESEEFLNKKGSVLIYPYESKRLK